MSHAHILGFPRIGARRELKSALESHWKGPLDETGLRTVGRELRGRHWALQRAAGLDCVTVGDFAFYDHLHNATALFSAAPARFGLEGQVSLAGYFAMARGTPEQPALAMKKWFDTNYHYLVPEVDAGTRFRLNRDWLLPELQGALAAGHRAKVVLPGPLTWLWLASAPAGFDKLSLLPALQSVYAELAAELRQPGVDWLQLDEPILSLDLPAEWLAAFPQAYAAITAAAPPVLLATYFGSVAEHAALLQSLPIAGLHLDLVRAPLQLGAFLPDWPQDKALSLGVIDGRNLWRTDLAKVLALLHPAKALLGERLWIAPSCSLLHVPTDIALEEKLDPTLKSWMAFAVQKLDELSLLKRALEQGEPAVWRELQAAAQAIESRRSAPSTRREAVRARVAALTQADTERGAPFAQRIAAQQAVLQLPKLPTTTIGSFPQTAEIRAARAGYKAGRLGEDEYVAAMQAEIRLAVEKQEQLGLDVLVHGEAERNDMVEYFGEQLEGYTFTQNGWVQSYGSRCVKPPVIHGDVSRPKAMTVAWSTYAQSLTDKPMKGMLSGPLTMLFWSFVRDDLPKREVALQLALALRDEVVDLETAGIKLIQIDEPTIREGLPLKQADWPAYLDWAVQAFRITAAGVRNQTQIHTHMCYSEFNDILPAIAALDADVITIETSRARMKLLDGFAEFNYPNDIGPGLYDIHSPRVPAQEEMQELLQRALKVVPAERLWVNPDCGLKTRGWPETEAALKIMVATARVARAALN
ncbi:5-methyltetrahydropteroyltriglutamate--homocysteine S-methyltransferase [Solimonas sp. K1W22B-7]|uniref:5-methyltetrahydropteroyltriglutamate-- homocysteine S-methyltransferase n=1 Tax=Solimonas sp. K1W22B-7 TaxID=2303331 RepID=UPI000E336CA6|nr:5-methyltetrahydropteroyltriglutamate--homocysteine S-methyltransferase [Solimonas sp. K1W22B-7]AXQ31374.1 5-methyltetrahydropteroyltriglutamate--homocysteine S-methyltransferase [Solimonas sp. K1W22B-7]